MKGKVHSIETFGTLDGPGIRYVVFLQGCHLRCVYCHNPDTWNVGCKKVKVKTVDEIINDYVKYESYYSGITISGGEPLLQKNFVLELFYKCKMLGIHTVLDTSGHDTIDKTTRELLNHTDLVIFDMKTERVIGQSIEESIAFTRYLDQIKKPIWVRYVLVPGITDAEADLKSFAEIVKPLCNVEKLILVPFHQLGAHKWEMLELEYTLKNTKPPTKGQIEKAKKVLKKNGLEVE